MQATFLVLEDGTCYPGLPFGAPAAVTDALSDRTDGFVGTGEVVFNTAMAGYHEVLTDPSYTGQIVAMTYPHIGNYGTAAEWSETGPEDGLPAPRSVKAAGFVVRSVYRGPVPAGRIPVDDFLRTAGIPGISEVDTRALTLHLRDHGALRAAIVTAEASVTVHGRVVIAPAAQRQVVDHLSAFPDMLGRNLIGAVGAKQPVDRSALGIATGAVGTRLALVDCGIKHNIIRELEREGCRVVLYPSTVDAATLRAANASGQLDGVLISNGPGDPAVLHAQIATIRALLGTMPVFGICLGHQLIAEALGARTFKMKFGHHGVNHPVRDERSKKVFVTSQNHGFAVDESSLPSGVEVWFRNANDQTIEGLRHDGLGVLTAQFHPESAPGPHDSQWIFHEFVATATAAGRGQALP